MRLGAANWMLETKASLPELSEVFQLRFVINITSVKSALFVAVAGVWRESTAYTSYLQSSLSVEPRLTCSFILLEKAKQKESSENLQLPFTVPIVFVPVSVRQHHLKISVFPFLLLGVSFDAHTLLHLQLKSNGVYSSLERCWRS